MTAPKAKIIFNGQEIEAEAGKPLLQAAIDAGIEVPHFCYHPGIGIEGSCRLCLVEIQGMPKLQTSCTIPLKEGMVVSSVSEPVKKARKGVLEFFLLNHPLDCPICDKGGECPLQNYSLDSGQSTSRMELPKLHKEKHQVIGDHIVLDKERCVLCNRCVRFGRNLTGHEELQIRNRGAKSEIFVPEGGWLTNGFTGNLADICPVGALTTREFRFRARPWEMKTTDSICGECSLGCSLQVWKRDNTPLRFTPRIEPAVNEWWLCDKGRFSLHGHLTPDRVKNVVRFPAGANAISPEAVAKSIAAEISHVPAGAFAVIADPTLTNEEVYSLKAMARASGKGRMFIPASRALLEARNLLRKKDLLEEFPAALETAAVSFVIGESIEKDHPVLVLRLRRLLHAKGMAIVTAGDKNMGLADIRSGHLSTETAEDAAIQLFEQLAALENGTTQTSSWSPMLLRDQVYAVFLGDAAVTEKSLPAIRKWAEAASKRSAPRAQVSILLTGANLCGMLDQWDDTVHPQAELMTEIQRGKVEGLFWFGRCPDTKEFAEFAKGMRMFVQVVAKPTDIHSEAKWVLPLDSFMEKDGTYTNTMGRVQVLRKTVRVIDKGLAPSAVIAQISILLGVTEPMITSQVYREVAKHSPGYPSSWNEIGESQKTYAHYERVLWR